MAGDDKAESLAPGLHVDGLRALYEQAPASLVGNAIGMALIGLAFWPLASAPRLLGWLAAAVLFAALRLAHYLRYRAARDSDGATLLAWRSSWRALVLAQGSMWPLAVWLFWGLGAAFHTVMLIVIANSYTLASVQLLAPQRKLFFVFSCIVLLPTMARVASDTSQAWHWQLAGVLGLVFVVAMTLGRAYRGALSQAIGLKQRTEQLAAQLRVEKAAADAARRSAEAANSAKTRFFAAASHDLRQPLHAMGLFAEALRQKSQRANDPEVVSLVNSINQSVDALEGLFGELLDITRIDSGGVEVQSGPVSIKALFARLRLTFEPTAFEKGLALSFHGERHFAHTDGLLLERILRNLVSNAIRYSEDGGVLVACRPKPGDKGRLIVQVWDSGIGIGQASLPQIFDEFYQVQTSRPIEPHQPKGLGLGLAIVKRLADLLEARLGVRSRLGHGTVFTLEVPLGRAPRSLAPAAAAGAARLGLTLQGRRLVVVEDEPAVREGLTVLLAAWGAAVEAFEDIGTLQQWLATPALDAPDLLIVDYRLPEGRTGVDALACLRARWPAQTLLAVVITGSSLGGHEDEAAEHDFHLLIKPVLPNKLRAMIGFKLGLR
ncbi:MAG: hybrid sensor histidine kinase/response regulator [Burkholderiaceae bacterium]|nr:hybrid sensor histidine kinase/response regulator [Burkholderiaceae bacterium]